MGEGQGMSWGSGVLYTKIINCHKRGINPIDWLTDVFHCLPTTTHPNALKLLPANWKKQPACPNLSTCPSPDAYGFEPWIERARCNPVAKSKLAHRPSRGPTPHQPLHLSRTPPPNLPASKNSSPSLTTPTQRTKHAVRLTLTKVQRSQTEGGFSGRHGLHPLAVLLNRLPTDRGRS